MSDLQQPDNYGEGEVVPLWRTTAEQKKFSSWASGLAGGGDDGLSNFSTNRSAETPASSEDPDADIFDVAYKKGWEDGQAALAEEHSAASQASDVLAEAIQHLNDLSSSGSCAFILSAVESLFRRCAEIAVPDPKLLQSWAMQLAELVDQDQKGVTLVLHPDDISLIDSSECTLALRGDESMLRGNLKLSHAGGWIEKGSEVVLDELRTLIDEFDNSASVVPHD
ncbi:MAG: hypothetical protein ABJF89_11015 [Parasphingorhabdus sp.]|uniref:FliH/SctL family protein n=1 Tax=Parasphingorhabdus sp. TaxID=2709688 RepID=UPI0032658339